MIKLSLLSASQWPNKNQCKVGLTSKIIQINYTCTVHYMLATPTAIKNQSLKYHSFTGYFL